MSSILTSAWRPLAFAPAVFAAFTVILATHAADSTADEIDLSLNLFYTNPMNAGSGGTWQLAAKTDGFGLAGLFVRIRDISAPENATLLAPTGTVNAGADQAGFLDPYPYSSQTPGHHLYGLIQVPLISPATDQSAIYGVGSITDPEGGVPHYTGAATDFPDATSIGPELTTLENISNPVWGDGDPLGDPAWDHAAILLSGSFAPGQTPAFFSAESQRSNGKIFTDLPIDSSSFGALSATIDATTIARSNLALITGDYNRDGTVNIADYTVWRDTLGATVTPAGSGADGDGSGVVDAGDYTEWKINFGSTMPAAVAGGFNTSPIPEPQTLFTAVLSAVFVGAAFRRGHWSGKHWNSACSESNQKP